MLVLDAGWIHAIVLLWIRVAALLSLAPFFSLFRGAAIFRVLITLALAATLAAGLKAEPPSFAHPLQLMVAAASEALVGAVLAFGIHAAFGALHFIAKLLDLQMGLGIGGVFDPGTRAAQSSALGLGLQLLGVVAFFALDGHQAMLRGLVFSIEQAPLGLPFTAYSAEAIVAQFGAMFSLALMFGIPVVLALLLLEAGLAIVSRALPQMPVFFVSIPVKLFIGLGLLAAVAANATPLLGSIYSSIFGYWGRVLADG